VAKPADYARLVRLDGAANGSPIRPWQRNGRRRARLTEVDVLEAILDEYELSPAVRDVVARSLCGENIDFISQDRGTATSTIKRQRREVFIKTGTAEFGEFAADAIKRLLRIAAELTCERED